MPEVLTLVLVAVLGVLVGAVGVAAFRLSQRAIDREETVEADPTPGLSPDVLAVLNSVPGIVIVLDRDGAVLRADAEAYAKGLTRGDRLAHTRLDELVAQVRRTGSPAGEEIDLPRSALDSTAPLTFLLRVAPMPAERILIVAEDRTLAHRNEATRRDFTANVSHELKTPVGAIRLLADTIAENPSDPEAVAHFAARMTKEAQRLSHLISDIVDLSRLQAPDPLDSAELIDMRGIVDVALQQQELVAQGTGITLVPPLPTTEEALVWGNADMLLTAVRNLLDNAVRYSEAGGRVSVGVTVEDDLVSVGVVDSGIGISEEDQQRIFERFYRVDPARSRATGGTGLGLSIVKHVASDHGGTVTVWSRPGRGSTFTLVLPQATLPAGDTIPEEEP